jgi:acyl carrier protein
MDRVAKFVRTFLTLEAEAVVTWNTNLRSLNLESILFVELLVALEKEFEIELMDEDIDLSLYETVGDLAGLVYKRLRKEI